MSFVEKMKMEGREEGVSQGLSRGEWIGKVRLLEELMGAERSPMDELIGLDVGELARRFAALQADYNRQYKGR